MPAVLRIIPTRVQTVHRNTRKPASLLDSQFLNLSRDGVATKPQTLCGFDPATVQHVERRSNDRSLECLMKNKQIIVRCTYSDADQTLAELIKESFRFFLQKELFALAIRQPM